MEHDRRRFLGIVIDNDYAIWRAFDNHYWPALYFVDGRGRVRDHHFGEGEYERSEKTIQRSLGAADTTGLVSVAAGGVEAAADWGSLKSPETYVGHERIEFHARDLHLVMGPPRRESPVRVRVSIDGRPPGPAHGLDVDEEGYGTLVDQRMYQLLRQPPPIVDRQFEIEFLDPGVEAFAVTFG